MSSSRSIREDSIINLLRSLFLVPNYQRLYSWDLYNVQTLWEDIETARDKDIVHFMSALLIKQGISEKSIIVDGQQRLVTLTLLLKASIDLLPAETAVLAPNLANAKANAEKLLYEEYWGNNPLAAKSGEKSAARRRDRIELANESSGIYKRVMGWKERPNLTSQEISGNRMIAAYEFFYQKLVKLKEDEDLFVRTINTVLHNLNFIYIPISENEPAQKIYESVNGFTKEMHSGELIKNFALMSLSDEDSIQRLYKEHWSYFDTTRWTKDDVAKDSLTKILYYWMMSEGVEFPMVESEIYKGYKTYISAIAKAENPTSKIEAFSKELHKAVVTHQKAEQGYGTRLGVFHQRVIWGTNAHLANSVFFTFVKVFSRLEEKFGVSLTEHNQDDLLLPVESYIIRRFLSKNEKNRFSVKNIKWLIKTIEDANSASLGTSPKDLFAYIKKFRSFLAGRMLAAPISYAWLDNEMILLNVAGGAIAPSAPLPLEFHNERLAFARMLLVECELHLAKKDAFSLQDSIPPRESSLEHWMPQNPVEDEWPLANTQNRKAYTHALGNLSLLPGELNSKLGNKSLVDKISTVQSRLVEAFGKPIRKETSLSTFNSIFRVSRDQKKWAEAEVKARGQELVGMLAKVFPDLDQNKQTGAPFFNLSK